MYSLFLYHLSYIYASTCQPNIKLPNSGLNTVFCSTPCHLKIQPIFLPIGHNVVFKQIFDMKNIFHFIYLWRKYVCEGGRVIAAGYVCKQMVLREYISCNTPFNGVDFAENIYTLRVILVENQYQHTNGNNRKKKKQTWEQ